VRDLYLFSRLEKQSIKNEKFFCFVSRPIAIILFLLFKFSLIFLFENLNFSIFIIGSNKTLIFFSEKILLFINSLANEDVGVVTLYILFEIIFHKNFLKMFNLGLPEIRKINLVSKLNKYKRISGKAVFK
jgi:hypothetical protein